MRALQWFIFEVVLTFYVLVGALINLHSPCKPRFQGLFEAPIGLQIRDHSGVHLFTPLFIFIEFLSNIKFEDTVVNKTESFLPVLKKISSFHTYHVTHIYSLHLCRDSGRLLPLFPFHR